MSEQGTEPAPAGRRAQKKAANRAAILAAGRRVFGSVGYDAATIRDVVRESGLSPGTFYNYFPDKETVFAEIIGDLLGRMRPRLVKARNEATSLDSFLRDAFRAAVETLFEDREILDVVAKSAGPFREHLYQGDQLGGLYDELHQDLAKAVELGVLPPLPPDLTATAMIGASVEICVFTARSAEQEHDAVDRASTFLADLFLGGIPKLGKRSRA